MFRYLCIYSDFQDHSALHLDGSSPKVAGDDVSKQGQSRVLLSVPGCCSLKENSICPQLIHTAVPFILTSSCSAFVEDCIPNIIVNNEHMQIMNKPPQIMILGSFVCVLMFESLVFRFSNFSLQLRELEIYSFFK